MQDHRGKGGWVKPRLNKEQKQQLKQILTEESDFWTYEEIRPLVQKRFDIIHSKRQIQRLL